jgi:hypothetical protein
MSEDNLPAVEAGPVEDAPKTFDQQIERIGQLIGDPATDLAEEEETVETAEEGEAEEAEAPTEDVEQEDTADEDGSEEPDIKGGRFAPDTAKVTLDDGTVTTVAELKRNNLFQRDYTKKTTELKAEKEAVTVDRQKVDQQAQSLGQLSQYVNWFAEHYLPKQPEPFTGSPDADPIGYMKHMQSVEAWQQQQGLRQYFETELAKIEDGKKRETEAQKTERLRSEARALVEKDKTFADETKRMAFLNEAATKGAEYWGLTREEIAGIDSHKQWLILRDALEYRRLKAKAPAAVEQVKAKPKMVTGNNRRVDPGNKANSERRVLSERLRKSGSIDDAVSLLSKFNI